jgi:hypothetical protein
LHLARQHQDGQQLGLATLGQAVLALRQGDLVRTRQRLHECLPLFQASHDAAICAALGLLGGLAIRRGAFAQGVRLLAAGGDDLLSLHRTRARIDPLLSFLHAEEEQRLAQARDVLGDTAFAQVWAEGQAMSLDQAVTCALDANAGGDTDTESIPALDA